MLTSSGGNTLSQNLPDLNIDTISRKRGSYLFIGVLCLVIFIYIIALAVPPHAHEKLPGIHNCNYTTHNTTDGVCKYFDIRSAQTEQKSIDNSGLTSQLANHIKYRASVNGLNQRNYAINLDFAALRSHNVASYGAFSMQ